jgi:hypothetical protein
MPTFHPAGLFPGRIKAISDLDAFRFDIKKGYDRAYGQGQEETA